MTESIEAIPSVDAAEMRRLRWQCRRGMRELDVMLERYLAQQYPQDDLATREVFLALLKRQDPEIASWVLGRETPADPATVALVDRLRNLYQS